MVKGIGLRDSSTSPTKFAKNETFEYHKTLIGS